MDCRTSRQPRKTFSGQPSYPRLIRDGQEVIAACVIEAAINHRE